MCSCKIKNSEFHHPKLFFFCATAKYKELKSITQSSVPPKFLSSLCATPKSKKLTWAEKPTCKKLGIHIVCAMDKCHHLGAFFFWNKKYFYSYFFIFGDSP
jgi:hypothetical protein